MDNRFFENVDLIKTIIERLPDSNIRDRFIEINNEKENLTISEMGKKFGSSGYVVESVPLAVFASTKIKECSYFKILEEVISIGGDTDTVASMASQIIGTYLGIRSEVVALFDRIEDSESIFRTFEKYANKYK
jgi:ADP-ribosylglycohydrolase